MIIDKHTRSAAIPPRSVDARGRSAPRSGIAWLDRGALPRSRWLRGLLMLLAIGMLTLLGAALGRGFEAGAVMSQALVPTRAAPTPAPLATRPAPAQPASGSAPATPLRIPPMPARIEESWPELLSEPFDRPTAGWPARRSPSWSADYAGGGYVLRLDGRPSISYSAPLRAHDFWYGTDLRIARGQAGLFFLIGRPNDFYRFLIDTDGRYQLEWQQVGVAQPLIAWTSSNAIQRGEGATNQIAVRRSGDELALYANGQLLASYRLPAGNALEGRIGLALDAPPGQARAQAWFDNLVVRAPE